MKNIFVVLLFVIVIVAGADSQVMIETFNYADGALVLCGANQPNAASPYYPLAANNVSGDVWTNGSSSSFDDPMLVQTGVLTYSGYSLSGQGKKLYCPNLTANTSNNRGYRSFLGQQTVYYSLMVNLRDVTGLSAYPSTSGEYFTGLWATGNATNANYRGLLCFRAGSTSGKYQMGVRANQPMAASSWVDTDLDPLTTYLVVVKYERNNPTCKASIWINPDLSVPEPAPNATSDFGAVDPVGGNTDIGRFGIYQRGGRPKVDIGGIRVGTTWNEAPLPVQLSSFSATALLNYGVRMDWRTISEVNNYGFFVQRKGQNETDFAELQNSFVSGHGTTNEPRVYSWTDNSAPTGSLQYRLKQVDLDGSTCFTEPINVDVVTSVGGQVPIEFSLKQNYPNPFNPSTTIEYTLPSRSMVSLRLYDLLGKEMMAVVSGTQEEGTHVIRLDTTRLASGVYFYRLNAGAATSMKKMVVMK